MLAEFGRVYPDRSHQSCVADKGPAPRQCQGNHLTYTFAVVDSPIVNALAIPEGCVASTPPFLETPRASGLAKPLTPRISSQQAPRMLARYFSVVAW